MAKLMSKPANQNTDGGQTNTSSCSKVKWLRAPLTTIKLLHKKVLLSAL